VITAQY